MKNIIKFLGFLFVFFIPYHDIPETFRGGIAISGIIGIVLLPLLLIAIKNKERVLSFPKIPVVFMMFFLLFYTFSMLVNSNQLEERAANHIFLYAYSFLIYTIITYVVMNIFGLDWVAKVLGYSVISISIIGFVEVFVYYTYGFSAYANFLNHGVNVGIFGGQFPRLRSTFDEPSHFALFMVCVLPILWYFKRKVAFAFGGIALIMTFSTSTFSAMAMTSALFIAVSFLKLSKKPLKFIFSLFAISFVALIVRLTLWESFYNKIFNIQTVDSYRYYTWMTSIQSSLEKPLMGHGPAGYYLEFDRGIFNWYLQIFYESGFFGLIALVTFLLVILIKTIKLKKPLITFFYLTFIFSMLVMSHYYIPGLWIFVAFVFHLTKENVKQNSTAKIQTQKVSRGKVVKVSENSPYELKRKEGIEIPFYIK